MLFGLVVLVVIGVLVGLIAGRVVDLRGDDPRLGIGLCVVAAVLAGGIYCKISGSPMALLNYWSWIYAAIAAVLAIIVWHIVRHRSPYARQTVRRSY
jgi:uncharacterized membrane protein YeaQ/YmgE (transglycosylase-associated protein family)